MKHTQGTWNTCHMDGWNVSFDFKGEGTVETHAISDANGKIVAFAVDHADEAFADLNTDHANLIAAAPELLDALKKTREIFAAEFDPSVVGAEEFGHMLDAVIAKAIGETK